MELKKCSKVSKSFKVAQTLVSLSKLSTEECSELDYAASKEAY